MLLAFRFLRPPRWKPVLVGLLVFAYAVTLLEHMGAYAGGADSSGYMNQAKLLAGRHLTAAQRPLGHLENRDTLGYLYVPLGFRPEGEDTLVPIYPTGLPLLLCAALFFGGWEHAATIVLLFHALVGLVLVYACGRTFNLSKRAAFVAAAIIGLSPLYLNYSIQLMSDLPALVWVTAAVICAWRARARADWACAAGAAVALAVLIRPNNLLLLTPVGIALDLNFRRWLWLGLGALPGTFWFGLYNRATYGGWLSTGYGDSSAFFRLHFVAPTLAHYGSWLPILFTPVIFGALFLPFIAKENRRVGAVLTAWSLVYLGFYAAYRHTHESWWFLRFVLPAAPALVIGGGLTMQRVTARWISPRRSTFFFGAALLAVSVNSFIWSERLDALDIGRGEKTYRLTAEWVNEHVPKNAALLCFQLSGSLYYYTPQVLLRWDQFEPANTARVLAAIAADGRPLFAVIFNWETEEALKRRVPGKWTQLESVRDVTIWRYEGAL